MHGTHTRVAVSQSRQQTVVIQGVAPGHTQQQAGLIDNEQVRVAVQQAYGVLCVRHHVRRLLID